MKDLKEKRLGRMELSRTEYVSILNNSDERCLFFNLVSPLNLLGGYNFENSVDIFVFVFYSPFIDIVKEGEPIPLYDLKALSLNNGDTSQLSLNKQA